MASNRAVELIAHRLSIRPEQAAQALGQLSAHLLQQVGRDQHVHVSGLGTFTQEGDILVFEPAEELNALANADFADLEPVTIRPSRPAARPGARTERAGRRRRARAGWALAGFVVVLAVAFLLVREQSPIPDLLSGLSPPDETSAAEVPVPETITGAAKAERADLVRAGDSAAASSDPSDEGSGPVIAAEDPAAPEPRAIDPARGGYTVVVASFRDPAVAQSEAVTYRALVQDAAVAVDVLRVVVEGTTQYRVSVGQVSSRSEALALKSRLASLPDDAWIRRIGIDS